MLKKDYLRLANCSLKAREKSTNTTIVGIVFGLVLLIPVIFLVFGFYGSILSQLANNSTLYYSVPHLQAELEYDDIVLKKYLSGSDKASTISEFDGYSFTYDSVTTDVEKISWDSYYMELKVGVDGGELSQVMARASTMSYTSTPADTMSIIPVSSSALSVAHSELIQGYDKGFYGDTKSQVILSENFFHYYNLDYRDYYGREISLYYRDGSQSSTSYEIYMDNDDDPTSEFITDLSVCEDKYLFDRYEVVGISENYINEYGKPVARDPISNEDILLTEASVCTDSRILPIYTTVAKTEYTNVCLATYSLSLQERQEICGDSVMLGTTTFTTYDYFGYDDTLNEYVIADAKASLYFCDDYASSISLAASICDTLYGDVSSESTSTDLTIQDFIDDYGCETISELYIVYLVISIVLTVFIIFGGIIFFSAMVNFYNSIIHSVLQRKHYLAVMRAIGARKDVIVKLYLAEVAIIFKKSIIATAIVSSVICVIVKLIFDAVLSSMSTTLGFEFVLAWYFIPLSVVVGSVILLLCGCIFVFLGTKKVTKSKITDILEDN